MTENFDCWPHISPQLADPNTPWKRIELERRAKMHRLMAEQRAARLGEELYARAA